MTMISKKWTSHFSILRHLAALRKKLGRPSSPHGSDFEAYSNVLSREHKLSLAELDQFIDFLIEIYPPYVPKAYNPHVL